MMHCKNIDSFLRNNFIDNPITSKDQFPDRFIFYFRNHPAQSRLRLK